MKKILLTGLPGSGKTTLAKQIIPLFDITYKVVWFNADEIRKQFNDWDFSNSGRIRQAYRMRSLAESSNADFVFADFVAPTDKLRNIFGADYTIWVNTIDVSRFPDTNKVFTPPTKFDYEVGEQNANFYSKKIYEDLQYRFIPKISSV